MRLRNLHPAGAKSAFHVRWFEHDDRIGGTLRIPSLLGAEGTERWGLRSLTARSSEARQLLRSTYRASVLIQKGGARVQEPAALAVFRAVKDLLAAWSIMGP